MGKNRRTGNGGGRSSQQRRGGRGNRQWHRATGGHRGNRPSRQGESRAPEKGIDPRLGVEALHLMGLEDIEPSVAGADDPGDGRRLALDVGTVRIGIASSDRDARMAMPVETVPRSHKRVGSEIPDGEDIRRIMQIVREYEPVEVIIGLPRDLKGNGSASVVHARDIGQRLERVLAGAGQAIPVRFADERLTTVIATQALHASGLTERAGRKVVDQAAAVEILQTWLDARRSYLATSQDKTQDEDGEADSNGV